MPLTQPVEHLQLFQPRQRAQATAFRFLGLDDVLKIGIHGWRKRFSNFAHASSSEWREDVAQAIHVGDPGFDKHDQPLTVLGASGSQRDGPRVFSSHHSRGQAFGLARHRFSRTASMISGWLAEANCTGQPPHAAIVSFRHSEYCLLMNAATGLDKQIGRYRLMTGEQRLAVALDLHEMSCDIAREGIRRQHPAADAEGVERLLRRRIELVRAA